MFYASKEAGVNTRGRPGTTCSGGIEADATHAWAEGACDVGTPFFDTAGAHGQGAAPLTAHV